MGGDLEQLGSKAIYTPGAWDRFANVTCIKLVWAAPHIGIFDRDNGFGHRVEVVVGCRDLQERFVSRLPIEPGWPKARAAAGCIMP